MNRILKQVAKKNNISVKEVRNEISIAIHEAMQTDDPNVQKCWKRICRNGKEPTPEELIKYICTIIKM